jgi:hypothetical protein
MDVKLGTLVVPDPTDPDSLVVLRGGRVMELRLGAEVAPRLREMIG